MSIQDRLRKVVTTLSESTLSDLFFPGGKPPKIIPSDSIDAKRRQAGIGAGRLGNVYGRDNVSTSYYDYIQAAQGRIEGYDTYDAMDELSDIHSVLDDYAGDSTQVDQDTKNIVWVEGEDQDVVDECNDLLHNILMVDDWAEGSCRDIAKYGDDFTRPVLSEDGVTSLEWLDPREIERIESRDGVLLGFEWLINLENFMDSVSKDVSVTPSLKPWEVIHFRRYVEKRVPGESSRNVYGTSILKASERPAKQNKILDDILMIARLTRGLDRYIFKVDVGNSAISESVSILKSWMRHLKRKVFIDPTTGRFDSRYKPMDFTQDIFWPIKENSKSDVTSVPGITDVKNIVDINYFRDKLFGSLRANKAFYGYEGEGSSSNTASSQSIKWARSVVSVQKAFKIGISRMCQIHLALKGLDTNSVFTVMMVNPSLLEQLERLEAYASTIDIADRMLVMGQNFGFEKRAWVDYIMRNVLWLSNTEIDMMLGSMEVGSEELGDVFDVASDSGFDDSEDEFEGGDFEEEPEVEPTFEPEEEG